MTDSSGEVIDFSHTTIFMTSNLGSNRSVIGFSGNSKDLVVDKIKDFLGYFSKGNQRGNQKLKERNIWVVYSFSFGILKFIGTL